PRKDERYDQPVVIAFDVEHHATATCPSWTIFLVPELTVGMTFHRAATCPPGHHAYSIFFPKTDDPHCNAARRRSQALRRDASGEPLQALPLGSGLGQQLGPIVRRMAAFPHLAEHPVGVVAALVGTLGALVIDPREHDHFAGRVVAEEQPVLLEELRPEPVLMIITKGAALTILRPRRILRDDVEGQLRDGRQSLAGVFL